MYFLNYFYKKTLKFDLINKFYYTKLQKVPKLKEVVLSFGCKTTDLKSLAICLLALELIGKQKGILTISKKPNLLLKIRKGNPTGCKLNLKNSSMLVFFSKSFNEVFARTKSFEGIMLTQNREKTVVSFIIKDILNFSELTDHYYLFNNVSTLNLSFITSSKVKEETLFLLKSLQLPIKSKKQSKHNSIGRV